MLILTIALTLTAQPELDRVRGLAFREIEISWIASTGTVHDFDQVLPWRQAALLRQLDCQNYNCRRLARDELAGLGDSGLNAILWGTHAKGKPDVVQACEALLSRLFLCRDCKGTGVCQGCKMLEDNYRYQCPLKCDYNHRCPTCGGIIDLRWKRTWNDEIVPRNLFERGRIAR